MAIGYDGGSYSGDLDEISVALGVDPDIEGVTSRLGTPVDRLGAATILGDAGIPLEGGLSMAQSLASLARIDPQLARDIMSGRTYMAGTGLLGQGYMEDPLLQQISLTGNEQGDTIHLGQRMGETHDEYLDRITDQEDFEKTLESITPTISKSLVKDAQDKLSKIYDKDYTKEVIKDRIQGAATDAVRSLIDPEEYDALPLEAGMPGGIQPIDSPMWGEEMTHNVLTMKDLDHLTELANANKVRDDILSGTQSFEVATPLGTTDIYDTETGEWTALTDTEKLMRGLDDEEVTLTELPWVDDEDELTAQKELAELIALNPTGRFRDRISPANTSAIRRAEEMSGLTMGAAYPSIDTTFQDTQADVMDEGYLAGLNMTAEESRALTRELNTLGRPRLDHEIEALKQGASIAGNLQTQKNLEELQESKFVDEGFLDGLSQAMKNVLNNDPELMAQYMAARSDIISQLDKTKFEHEEFYPGSQAAAVGAGYWGPLALGWNASYNDYKDAQRALMGKQPGQRFDSGDWINNLGWMTPEQINRLLGYGEPQMDALSHSEIDGNAELFGLVSFVKTNPEPFRALNEDEVWRLISNEDSFWEYYKDWMKEN